MSENGRYTLISADAHLQEPPDLFTSRLPASLRARAPRWTSIDEEAAWVVEGFEPVRVGPYDSVPALRGPTERVRAQSAGSVDAEVLYPSSGLWELVGALGDAELELACVQAYNDWLAAFCAAAPDRLIGLAKLPSTSVVDATEELRRAVQELHLRGAILGAWPSGSAAAGDPRDEPFWEAVDEVGVPLSIHHGIGAHAHSLPPDGIAPGMKPPMADAVLPLVAAGVFDRFPNVRLVFAHADAGWALHWLEFLDMNYVRHRHLDAYALGDPDALPSEYIRKVSWFTFHHDRFAVKNRHRFGSAHLLWASHFPLVDADWPDDRQAAMRVTEEVAAGERQALLADNTARLYRLPGHERGFIDGDVGTFETLVHFS